MNEQPSEHIKRLIENSSLGTPEAKRLRASVSDEDVARVMKRVRELEQEASEDDERAFWEAHYRQEGACDD